jgi:excisionase family DNA binding protein
LNSAFSRAGQSGLFEKSKNRVNFFGLNLLLVGLLARRTIPQGKYIEPSRMGNSLWYKGRVKTLTTVEVADRLGITARRVRALIESKQLPAEKKGRDYLIEENHRSWLRIASPADPTAGNFSQRNAARTLKKYLGQQ